MEEILDMAKKKQAGKNKWILISVISVFIVLFLYAVFEVVGKKEISSEEDYEGNYYKNLEAKCKQESYAPYRACCIESTYVMKGGNYSLADKVTGCPEGYYRNGLKCPGSYFWCEPVKEIA